MGIDFLQINYDPADPAKGLDEASVDGRLNGGWQVDDSGALQAFGERYAYLETGSEQLQQTIAESFYNSGVLVVDALRDDGCHMVIIPEDQLETLSGSELAQVASNLDEMLPKAAAGRNGMQAQANKPLAARDGADMADSDEDRLEPANPGEEFKEPPPPTPPPTLG